MATKARPRVCWASQETRSATGCPRWESKTNQIEPCGDRCKQCSQKGYNCSQSDCSSITLSDVLFGQIVAGCWHYCMDTRIGPFTASSTPSRITWFPVRWRYSLLLLSGLIGRLIKPPSQTDLYWAHPCRSNFFWKRPTGQDQAKKIPPAFMCSG